MLNDWTLESILTTSMHKSTLGIARRRKSRENRLMAGVGDKIGLGYKLPLDLISV